MTEANAPFFLPYVVGFFGVLVGIVWNDLNVKIKDLQDTEKGCPIHTVTKDIAAIKNDIQWIKSTLEKK